MPTVRGRSAVATHIDCGDPSRPSPWRVSIEYEIRSVDPCLKADVRRIAVRPQVGRNHAIHCVDVYQEQLLRHRAAEPGSHQTFAELLRRRSLVPVISDFLFEDPQPFSRCRRGVRAFGVAPGLHFTVSSSRGPLGT